MTQPNAQQVGLSSEQAKRRLAQYGKNVLMVEKHESFLLKVLRVISEPMFLLLVAAAAIYFLLGEMMDGAVMLVFVIGIIAIDAVQEFKTGKALQALHALSAPRSTVVRDGKTVEIDSEELVPGDRMLIREGDIIPADGAVLQCADLRVDESTLTGEAEGVRKVPSGTPNTEEETELWRRDTCYAGTKVLQGTGSVLVKKTGSNTQFGKIGADVAAAPEQKTLLQKQVGVLVWRSAIAAAALFVLVGFITYLNIPDHAFIPRLVESILAGITLSMAMIPEEFPVVLTVFLSMGAWRLAKHNALIRHLPAVETLGAVSVLCVDKTGTITQNKMHVEHLWTANCSEDELCEISGLACESETYDPMERAILLSCAQRNIARGHLFGGTMITEYGFTDQLKMMGHVWEHDGEIILAAKGSPERLFELCLWEQDERREAENAVHKLSLAGLRVIAVGVMRPAAKENIPQELTDAKLTLCGLIGLADPPREGIEKDIQACRAAGIRVVMITGDGGITAQSIAKRVGMDVDGGIVTGMELDGMSDEALCARVKEANIFARVVPAHKMRIVKALKQNGEIVAMTGDGVNDAPALKYADIGIAMGMRGSQVAREAADMVLLDDNFSTIVRSVADGRRIYDNIQKAVGYIFTIHIPIALSALFAPMLGIAPNNLMLLPLHVVLLELMIDPTCSIVLERQSAETGLMQRNPRGADEPLVRAGMLGKSVTQGLAIFLASFGAYYLALALGETGTAARAMGLMVLMLANVILVHVNASGIESIAKTFKKMKRDRVMWLAMGLTVLGLVAALYSPLNRFLKLAPLSAGNVLCALGLAAASVLWMELWKIFLRVRRGKLDGNAKEAQS